MQNLSKRWSLTHPTRPREGTVWEVTAEATCYVYYFTDRRQFIELGPGDRVIALEPTKAPPWFIGVLREDGWDMHRFSENLEYPDAGNAVVWVLVGDKVGWMHCGYFNNNRMLFVDMDDPF